MTRVGNRLVPAARDDSIEMMEIPEGKVVAVEVTQSRSRKMEKFYHALVKQVWDATHTHPTLDGFKRQIKYDLGIVDFVNLEDGSVKASIGSTDRDSMDQAEFKAFVSAAIDLMVAKYLKGMRRNEIIADIERRVGFKFADDREA